METKKRHYNHIIETKSLDIIHNILPSEWVIRKLYNDYGIDLNIEIFERSTEKTYETLGEYLYIQVKGTEKLNKCLYNNIEVIKYKMDVSELSTIERMGSAVPVLLFLVDIINREIYFVCLNDYIEKMLLREDSDYYSKKTKTIYLPLTNKISSNKDLSILLWYSKRAKLYYLFNKINYHIAELSSCANFDEAIYKYKEYANNLLALDIWNRREVWPVLNNIYIKLRYFKNNGICEDTKEKIDLQIKKGINVKDKNYELSCFSGLYTFEESELLLDLFMLWSHLESLGHCFEEFCKEWWLPISSETF